jgi:transcriptional regulator NrdR family protein
MNCPHCGARSLVLETRGVSRTRQCVEHSEHRFMTREEVVQRAPAPQGRPRSLRSQVKHWQHLQ